ncbi:hypothetical protein BKA70DRAFT_1516937 [Coprinopsis sp. MPI-PUGE-AT-0042]|nr:hypothetical protein BKA70DRAFT_1516937 [Coprinopsis sp. MPI-PUGE-AT-0042]
MAFLANDSEVAVGDIKAPVLGFSCVIDILQATSMVLPAQSFETDLLSILWSRTLKPTLTTWCLPPPLGCRGSALSLPYMPPTDFALPPETQAARCFQRQAWQFVLLVGGAGINRLVGVYRRMGTMHMDRQNHQDRRFVHLNDTGSSENVTRESLPWFSFVHANPAGQPPITASLESTSQQRDDETADQGPTIVKKVINSWFSSGFNNADINEQCFAIYKGQSEPTSLTARKAHCKQEFILAARSSSKYLKKSGSPEEVGKRMVGTYLEPLGKRFEGYIKVAGLATLEKLVSEGGTLIQWLPRPMSTMSSRRTEGTQTNNLSKLQDRRWKAVMLLCKDNKVTEEISKVLDPLAPFEPPDNSLTASLPMAKRRQAPSSNTMSPTASNMLTNSNVSSPTWRSPKIPPTVQTPPAAVARRQATTSPSPAIRILGTNFWLLNPPTYEYTIPPELTQTYQRF